MSQKVIPMNRRAIALACLVAWSPARACLAADWVSLGEGGGGQFQIAVDLDSVRRSGTRVTVLEKFTYRTPARYTQGRLIYAIKSNQSYDCEKKKTLLLNGFAYSDVDAKIPISNIRYTDNPSNYSPIKQKSIEERVLNMVCAEHAELK